MLERVLCLGKSGRVGRVCSRGLKGERALRVFVGSAFARVGDDDGEARFPHICWQRILAREQGEPRDAVLSYLPEALSALGPKVWSTPAPSSGFRCRLPAHICISRGKRRVRRVLCYSLLVAFAPPRRAGSAAARPNPHNQSMPMTAWPFSAPSPNRCALRADGEGPTIVGAKKKRRPA